MIKNDHGTFDFCCSYFEMIPAFLALGACVTGVATNIIKNRWFMIPHGVGALSSLYLFSLPPRIAIAKSIAARTRELRAQVGRLQTSVKQGEDNNERLEGLVRKFEENEKLSKENTTALFNLLHVDLPQKEEQTNARLNLLTAELVKTHGELMSGATVEHVKSLQGAAILLKTEIESLKAVRTTLQEVTEEVKKGVRKLTQKKKKQLGTDSDTQSSNEKLPSPTNRSNKRRTSEKRASRASETITK